MYLFCVLDPEEVAECWVENDSDLKMDCDSEPEELAPNALELHQLDNAQETALWWLVAFTCILQSLHSLPMRAVEFLLKFLSALLSYLGIYSKSVADIARAFPCSLHNRAQYLQNKLFIPPIIRRVVCNQCHTLYKFSDCFEECHGQMIVKP